MAGSAETNPNSPQYVLKSWSATDGAPISAELTQTKDGYLLLATDQSLIRFDGMRFTPFDNADAPQSRSDFYSCVYADRQGNIWMGTDDGLLQLSDGKFTRYTTKDGLSDNSVWTLTQGLDGDLWVGTGKGLNRLHDGRFTVYTKSAQLPNDNIERVYAGQDGAIWVVTHEGLRVFRGGQFLKVVNAPAEIASSSIFGIHQDRRGRLWFMIGGSLFLYQSGDFVPYGRKFGIPEHSIKMIAGDHAGALWIGTADSGLYRFDTGQAVRCSSEEGLGG